MKLKLVRHLWGVETPAGLGPWGKVWRDVGYEAIECGAPFPGDPQGLFAFLKEFQFQWIPQVYTRLFEPGGTVKTHLESFKSQVEAVLPQGPLLINAHSGSDTWTIREATDFFGATLDFEKATGVAICHETHRLRCFATPWQTRALLEALPDLKITADYSHWVVVCERLLHDLGDTLALCARHTHHLHSRVGFEEGPQVNDPFAPEWEKHLATHETWWDQIWKSQSERGMTVSTLTPEFGPFPYMHHLPHTQMPVANLSAICDRMAQRQKKRFHATRNET